MPAPRRSFGWLCVGGHTSYECMWEEYFSGIVVDHNMSPEIGVGFTEQTRKQGRHRYSIHSPYMLRLPAVLHLPFRKGWEFTVILSGYRKTNIKARNITCRLGPIVEYYCMSRAGWAN